MFSIEIYYPMFDLIWNLKSYLTTILKEFQVRNEILEVSSFVGTKNTLFLIIKGGHTFCQVNVVYTIPNKLSWSVFCRDLTIN
jgi:hypothetical protein